MFGLMVLTSESFFHFYKKWPVFEIELFPHLASYQSLGAIRLLQILSLSLLGQDDIILLKIWFLMNQCMIYFIYKRLSAPCIAAVEAVSL